MSIKKTLFNGSDREKTNTSVALMRALNASDYLNMKSTKFI